MICEHRHSTRDHEIVNQRCVNVAAWNKRCAEHGGVVPTVPELMTLLGELTNWSDQGLSVSIGYKRARVFMAQDETRLDNNTWGFVVSTRVCGQGQDIGAQGKTLEEALWTLCVEIVEQSSKTRQRASANETAARKTLDEFLWSRRAP